MLERYMTEDVNHYFPGRMLHVNHIGKQLGHCLDNLDLTRSDEYFIYMRGDL